MVDLPAPPAIAILCQLCGCLAYLFLARVAAGEVTSMATFVAEFLAVPADVEAEDDGYTVRLPMERIDPRVRRAGLDRDPGWVPWLDRSVRFVFN